MNIVVLDGYTLNPGDNSWEPIEKLGNLSIYDRTEPADIISRAMNADVVLTNKVVLSGDVIAKLPHLKMIAVTATGYNVVDVEAARKRGIPVTNVPVYSTDAVAQHVFAGLLSFIHKPAEHHQAIQNGDWQAQENFSFWLSPLVELSGKTMGLVGLGRIGRATAKIANAFGLRVVASSRRNINPLPYEGFEWLSIEDLFSQSDYISLHCPQTPETTGFVNSELIGKMQSTAVLINTARGGLVNEQDLAKALNAGEIGGALLDVVSKEPIEESNPLLGAKNCVLTPHIAWSPIESRRRLMETVAANIQAFGEGNPIHVVN
ncbi:MAG: D-2-hydroxyacid dehydrogenase [Planctomycetaceae bacterium]|nr:D-2-hydroxyacid dehydrogenase [Planctomycetaceae bacterium]